MRWTAQRYSLVPAPGDAAPLSIEISSLCRNIHASASVGTAYDICRTVAAIAQHINNPQHILHAGTRVYLRAPRREHSHGYGAG